MTAFASRSNRNGDTEGQVANNNNKAVMFLRLLWLISAAILVSPASANDCRAPDSSINAGIVKIIGEGAVGSGVVVAPGMVLTAAHVIEGMDDVDVTVGRKRRDARVISRNPRIDLALLAVDTGSIKPLPLRHSPLDEKASVWAVGYAFGKRLKTGRGEFRAEANRLLYTSAPVNFGQSGGGLLSCENGRLVLTGIIRAFGAEKRHGKLVRRNDFSVATRTNDTRLFVKTNQRH